MRPPGGLPRLWQRGLARASLIRREPTFNPAPAAAYLLGIGPVRPTLWSQGHARRRLVGKRTRTHNFAPAALAVLGIGKKLGGVLGRFKQPSEKRAAGPAAQLVAAAIAGNATAARTIYARTLFGISKERQVWIAALAQLSPDLVALAHKHPELDARVDNSGPEKAAASAIANAVDVAELATSVSGKAKGYKPGLGTALSAVASGVASAGRAARAPRGRAPSRGRKANRYNPDPPHQKISVYPDEPEYETWLSRKPPKPRRQIRAMTAAKRRLTTAAERTVTAGIGRAGTGVASVAAAAGVSTAAAVTGLAIAGVAAYLATTAVQDGIAESDTLENAVARMRSMSATQFQARFGRRPTVSEYATLRRLVAQKISDLLGGSPAAAWRRFLTLFKGS